MLFGISMFVTDESINAVELGRAAEERGFESIFFPEHSHIPASRRTPWPGGAELPREYARTLDPFVALSMVTAATTRLRVGTGVCLVMQRDPIILAKEVATLDWLSGGRFIFGIGGGWNREEMEDHGTDPHLRWEILRERTQAMQAIWSQEEATFHGRFVNFDAIWQWPKPVQRPYPPVLIGGDGPRTFQRIVEYGDGWMPLINRASPPVADRIPELQRLAAEAGRGPLSVSLNLYGVRPEPALLNTYAAAGVERCVLALPPGGRDAILPRLDRLMETITSWGG
jgi:probable F420-dependent oxidoreductase